MRFRSCRIVVALGFAAAIPHAHAAQTSMAASLRVTVDGITSAGGNLIITLFDEATFSLAPDSPLFRQTVANPKSSAAVTFNRLPPGAYAVKALQDVNRDGKPDAGEPAAISNGAAADNFDAAAIAIQPGNNDTTLHLR